MRRIHSLAALLLLAITAPVFAQKAPEVKSAPDVRPPPMEILDDNIQPQVTIKKRDGETVEEFRVNGRLYKVRVTPEHGVPYTLVDQKGDGTFTPIDGPGAPALSVPMWVIGTF